MLLMQQHSQCGGYGVRTAYFKLNMARSAGSNTRPLASEPNPQPGRKVGKIVIKRYKTVFYSDKEFLM